MVPPCTFCDFSLFAPVWRTRGQRAGHATFVSELSASLTYDDPLAPQSWTRKTTLGVEIDANFSIPLFQITLWPLSSFRSFPSPASRARNSKWWSGIREVRSNHPFLFRFLWSKVTQCDTPDIIATLILRSIIASRHPLSILIWPAEQ